MTDQDREKYVSMGIKITRLRIESEIEALQKELDGLMKVCKHPNEVGVHRTLEDDYGSAIGYRVEYSCPDCNSRRSEKV